MSCEVNRKLITFTRQRSVNPGKLAAWAAALIVACVVLAPVAILILISFSVSFVPGDIHLTLGNYTTVLGSAETWTYLRNSVVYTVGAAILAMILAVTLAWCLTSVNVPGRRWLRLLPLGVLLLPPLVKDPAWILLYAPRTGLINLGLEHLFHLSGPVFNIYSMPGLITVMGFNSAPIAYITMLGSFESIDRSVAEASRVSGAGALRTLRTVTLPIVRPAIASAALLITILIAGSFETPVLIGIPGGIITYMSAIYQSISVVGPGGFTTAAAESSIYILLTAALLFIYIRSTKNERRFIAISGRGHEHAVTRAPVARYLLLAFVVAYALIALIMPLIVTVLVSLVPYYTATGGNPFSVLTLQNYPNALHTPYMLDAIETSGWVSFLVVVGSLAIGGVLAYVSLKTRARYRRLAEVVGMAPMAVPAMVFSVGLLLSVLFTPGVAPLVYGGAVPMIVANIIVFLPFATRLMSVAIVQLQDELFEVSKTVGAGRWRTAFKITIPLLRPAIMYTAAVIFVLSYRELGAIVLLVATNTQLIPLVTFQQWVQGGYTAVATLNVITLALPLLVGLLLLSFAGRRGLSRRRAVSL
jgi:iron(III) transport system permease protein